MDKVYLYAAGERDEVTGVIYYVNRGGHFEPTLKNAKIYQHLGIAKNVILKYSCVNPVVIEIEIDPDKIEVIKI